MQTDRCEIATKWHLWVTFEGVRAVLYWAGSDVPVFFVHYIARIESMNDYYAKT